MSSLRDLVNVTSSARNRLAVVNTSVTIIRYTEAL